MTAALACEDGGNKRSIPFCHGPHNTAFTLFSKKPRHLSSDGLRDPREHSCPPNPCLSPFLCSVNQGFCLSFPAWQNNFPRTGAIPNPVASQTPLASGSPWSEDSLLCSASDWALLWEKWTPQRPHCEWSHSWESLSTSRELDGSHIAA